MSGSKRWFSAVAAVAVMTMMGMSIALAGENYAIYLPYVEINFTDTPMPSPTPTPTPTGPPTAITGDVEITHIFYNGAGSNEPDEYVVIQNMENFAIQLQGWTLRDEANHIFAFPNFVIQPNQVCRVYTNQNLPQWCGFNYGSGSAIWNNDGDCGILRNSSNQLIDQYCY